MSDVTTAPETETVDEGPVILTDSAAEKIKELIAREENAEQVALRIAVQPGGCSGMRYALFFDDRQLDGDVIASLHDVPVRIDKMSAPYLRGTRIDWVDSLQGAGFSIDNPNAESTCACGDSFH